MESFNRKRQSMKQMWRELGNLLNTNKKSNHSVSGIIVDNKILNNDKDIYNLFSGLKFSIRELSFFSSRGGGGVW